MTPEVTSFVALLLVATSALLLVTPSVSADDPFNGELLTNDWFDSHITWQEILTNQTVSSLCCSVCFRPKNNVCGDTS